MSTSRPDRRTRTPESPRVVPLSEDLRRFGLDDETWLDHVRDVVNIEPLGTLGPYEILEEVSRGGQGIVFRARRQGITGDIALKRPLAGGASSAAILRRFRRELDTAVSLHHPNIVNVFDVNEVAGTPLLAMEWIDGVPISDWAAGAVNQRRILDTFVKVCDAVQHAHQRGIMHRDLKPSNILVDAAAEPHVLDFGLAKGIGPDASDESVTVTDQFLGTPAYAAPEQLGAGSGIVDVRSDIYSLGAILYQMLTGELPHRFGGSLIDFLNAIRDRDPARPSSLKRGIGRELDAILLKSLAKEPAARYQSVEAFAADVRRFLNGEPVVAHPPSPFYAVTKLVKRYKLVSSLVGVLALSILGFGISASLLAKWALDARESEVSARHDAEQLNNFLLELIASPAAAMRRGDVTVYELLEDSAARVDTGLVGQPQLAADLRFTIGKTYFNLNRYDKAAQHLEAASRLYDDLLGKASEKSCEARLLYAQAIAQEGRAEGLELARDVWERYRIRFGDGHSRTLSAMRAYGFALTRCVQPPEYARAVRIYEDILTRLNLNAEQVDPELPATRHALASALWRSGKLDEAARSFIDARTAYIRRGEMSTLGWMRCNEDYAQCLVEMDRPSEAETVQVRLVDLTRRVLGDAWVPGALASLAETQIKLGALDAATDSLEQALRLLAQRLSQRVRSGADEFLALANQLSLPQEERTRQTIVDAVRAISPYASSLEIGPTTYLRLLENIGTALDAKGATLEADEVRGFAAAVRRADAISKPPAPPANTQLR